MHRSKETMAKPGTQFGSYMMNKKWPLEEQFANHMMRFHQVWRIFVDPIFLHFQFQAGLLLTEIPFKEEEEEEQLERLRMEHFYLPLIILFGGLFLSTVTFMLEIIICLIQRNDRDRL